MSSFLIENISIRGVAACVPKDVESNNAIDYINPKELEFLIKNVGVKQKRKIQEGVTCSDLCMKAASGLLEKLGWQAQDVDVLIYVSQSRDYILPCTAIILQDKLGLGKSTLAFDIPLGCSGYTYGISVIAGLMSATKRKKGLLLAGDVSTNMVSTQDKKAFPLFGDAGTATALEYSNGAPLLLFEAGSDGSGFESIIIPGGGCREPLNGGNTKHNSSQKDRSHLHMDGMKVFEFGITQVPQSVKALLEFGRKTHTDIDYFVMHQANLLLNETIRKKLRFEVAQVPYSLENFGNTSAASIPLTMVSELQQPLSSKRNEMLCSGFGVGLSWCSLLAQTENLTIPALFEYD